MTRSNSREKILAMVGMAALVAAISIGMGMEARAELIRHSTAGAVVGNYYVPPGDWGVGASMYPCPRPTPPVVGHTYITYPPLAPHEFMYPHKRVYWTAHQDAAPTRTSVRWGWRPW